MNDTKRAAGAEGPESKTGSRRKALKRFFSARRPVPRAVEAAEDYIWHEKHETMRGARGFFWRWTQILDLAIQGIGRHNCALRASALTYTTFLSAVPLLAIAFTIAKALGIQEDIRDLLLKKITPGAKETTDQALEQIADPAVEQIAEPALEQIGGPALEQIGGPALEQIADPAPEQIADLPLEQIADPPVTQTADPVEQITEFITSAEQMISGTSVQFLGGFGGVALLFTSIAMMATLERALNAIWGVEKGRSFFRKAVNYIAVLVFGPILLAVGIMATTVLSSERAVSWAGPFADLLGSALFDPILMVLPFVAIWAIFIFIYQFIPNTRVSWKAGIFGGIIGGGLWQIAQLGYIKFMVSDMSRSNLIYGSFAWIAILFIWVYFSWIILLFGAELSFACDNLADRRRRRRAWSGTPAEQESLALRLASMLARSMLDGPEKPFEALTVERVADELRVPPQPIEALIELFTKAGLTTAEADGRGFLFCRAPHEVRIIDLLNLVRHGRMRSGPQPGHGIFDELGAAVRESCGDATLKDLAAEPIERIRTFSLTGVSATE